jgi:uncharacterized membrane protein (DUF373 family)
VAKGLARIALAVEFVAAVAIAVAAVLAVLAALRLIPGSAREIARGSTETADLVAMISDLLLAFIAIELLRIALAYIRGANVLPTVLEAGLVAVVRQVVLFHPVAHVLSEALSLAVLLLALATTWLVFKNGFRRSHDESEESSRVSARPPAAHEGPPPAGG